MSDIQSFDFNGSSLRVIDQDGEPWFVAKDVCDVLNHSNPRMAVSSLDEDEKDVNKVYTLGGEQSVIIINESGLYSLVLRSNKPEAKAFKKWVTSEVLPSIRKHGGYLTAAKTEELIANPDLIIQMAQSLKDEREKRKLAEQEADRNRKTIELQGQVITKVQPKVQYYEKVLATEDCISINVIAKELGMSAVSLNRKLRDLKVIYKQGGTWLLYQRYQSMGYTKTRTHTYTGSDGKPHTAIHTVWTQKGREFIHGLINHTNVS
jgi:anti-repressor protein